MNFQIAESILLTISLYIGMKSDEDVVKCMQDGPRWHGMVVRLIVTYVCLAFSP